MSREIERLRARIQELDEAIIRLLAQRFERVRLLALRKALEKLPVADPEREAELEHFYGRIAAREGIDERLVKRIFAAIHVESRAVQRAARRRAKRA